MKTSSRLFALLLCLVMMFSVAAPASFVMQAEAATAGSTKTTIKLNKTKASMFNGRKLKLKVTGTKKAVTWSTADKKIATVKKGIVTAKKAGTVKIRAKVAGKTLTCKVTVKPALIASIKSATIVAGKYKKATLKLYAADGDVACKIGKPSLVSYKFGDWNGNKIAIKFTGKKAGTTTATITNTVTNDRVKIKITVQPKPQPKPAAKPLSASATTVSLAPGEVKNITLTESAGSQIALTAAQPSVVRCSWSGAWVKDQSVVTLTGLKQGKTTVTVADTGSKQSVVLNVVVGCDHVFSDAYIVDKAATCTTPGKESTHCVICGAVGTTREIPVIAHDFAEEYTIDKASTCSQEGEQSRHCKVCGERTDIKPVEKAPHDYGVPTVTKEATCKEPGSQTKLCRICGAQKVETIPASEHKTGAWTVEKAATCGSAGVEAATCSVCGSKVTREIPKTDKHTFGAWTVEKAATCKDPGVEASTCTVCGTKQTREIPTANAHSYGSWTVEKAATCKEAGVESATCTVCGTKQTREIAKLTTHSFGEWTTSGDQQVRTCTVCGYKETKAKEAQPGETFQNPLSGQSNAEIEYHHYSSEPVRKVKINLKNIVTGAAANALAESENSFNTDAGNGYSWRFFFFEITYVSSTDGSNDVLSASDLIQKNAFFKTNGASVQIKDTASFAKKYNGMAAYESKMYPGSTTEVVYAVLIPDNSGDLVLRVPKSSGKENTWISMKAPELDLTGDSNGTATGNPANPSGGTTTPSNDVAANLTALKNYLYARNQTNAGGFKYIDATQKYYSQQMHVQISYEYVKKEFMFFFSYTDSSALHSISFSIPETPTNAPINCSAYYHTSANTNDPKTYSYSANFDLNMKDYKSGDALNYVWGMCSVVSLESFSHPKAEDYYDKVATDLNTIFKMGMTLTDKMLSSASLHMSDIGFASFSA